MSINAQQQIKCPKCGQLHEINVWHSITVSDSPDLKADLLAGKINMFRCDSCGAAALLPTPLLYHDEEQRLMISFTPCTDELTKQQLFDNIRASSKESGELDALDDYNLRFVTDYNALLEKLLIFDNGLHDKVTEVLKLMVLMQEPDKMEQRTAMFGKTDGDGLEFMVFDKKEEACYTSRVPYATYNTIKEELRRSGVKYRSFDWEIVDADYAARLLNGFNNRME